MAKKRRDYSSGGEPKNNPFGELAGLRDRLPEGPKTVDADHETPERFAPKVIIRRERSGRGGKTVTVIEGVRLTGDAREDFVRDLRRALGTSGRLEGDAVVLGGDVGDRAATWLETAGATRIVHGN